MQELEAEQQALNEEFNALEKNKEPIKARTLQLKEDKQNRTKQIQEILQEERNVDASRQGVVELRQELIDKINVEKQKLERDLQYVPSWS